MLISSIVVGAGLYFYLFVQDNNDQLQEVNQLNYSLEFMHEKLNGVFLEADEIKSIGKTLILSVGEREVEIELNSESLVILDGKTDTLIWTLNDYNFEYDKNSKSINGTELFFDFEGLEFEWYFYKDYGVHKKVKLIGR